MSSAISLPPTTDDTDETEPPKFIEEEDIRYRFNHLLAEGKSTDPVQLVPNTPFFYIARRAGRHIPNRSFLCLCPTPVPSERLSLMRTFTLGTGLEPFIVIGHFLFCPLAVQEGLSIDVFNFQML
jgi:hypothetical protein